MPLPPGFTVSNGLWMQQRGAGVNIWGDTRLNTQLGKIDQALDGITSVTLSNGASVTLSTVNGDLDQNSARVIALNGAVTTTASVVVANKPKWWWFYNNTTGGGTVTVRTSVGASEVIGAGQHVAIRCDGTALYRLIAPLNQLDRPTGPVDFNGQRLINVAPGIAVGDGVNFGQVNTLIATAVTPTPFPGTLRVSAGDIQPDYLINKIVGPSLSLSLLNPGGDEKLQIGLQNASTTVSGVIEIATQAESNAGTDNTRAITPATQAETARRIAIRYAIVF